MIKVVYYKIEDLEYPRNRMIRGYLAGQPDIEVLALPKTRGKSRLSAFCTDVRRLWAAAAQADVIVVAEFKVRQAPVALAIGRLRGAKVVVDGFVGRYETLVEDWAQVDPASLKARQLKLEDLLSYVCSDLYLTDTEVRAARVTSHSPRTKVLSVPVGAPGWATAQPPRKRSHQLEILYYGNYVPLHGLELVAQSLAELDDLDWHVTLVGDGERRPAIEAEFETRGLDDRCTFQGPVPEHALAELIHRSDLVLGVFGSSSKARSVLANKVWQGLACGRPVLTQESPALDEIRPLAGDLLVTSIPGDASDLAAQIRAVARREAVLDLEVTARLRRYVDEGLAALVAAIRPSERQAGA